MRLNRSGDTHQQASEPGCLLDAIETTCNQNGDISSVQAPGRMHTVTVADQELASSMCKIHEGSTPQNAESLNAVA
jgi:hypothetical protein